jgi:hypothetical protein
VVSAAELAEAVRQGKLTSLEQLIFQVEGNRRALPGPVRQAHAAVLACVQAGDPTPFKAFRRKEYEITVAAMGCLGEDAPVQALLEGEITLTQEVRRMALEWRRRGALVFGLSDKPDEASIPSAELTAQGFQALHRTPTHAVGV